MDKNVKIFFKTSPKGLYKNNAYLIDINDHGIQNSRAISSLPENIAGHSLVSIDDPARSYPAVILGGRAPAGAKSETRETYLKVKVF